METSYLSELRLTAYKSFHDAVLPLGELTLVVGRNGSGKSNALDGLWALARMAHGDDVRDALDGGRDGPAVRGGVTAGAPFGEPAFALGCTVRTGATSVDLDVTVRVEPHVQVVEERLAVDGAPVLWTDPVDPDSSDITARWQHGVGGPPPAVRFRASRLLATQVLARVPATEPGRRVHLAAAQVLAALRSVFVLDPVPHLMRQYVPHRDVRLRRDADNLSAAVADLIEQPGAKEQLRRAVAELNEQDVRDVRVARSDLGDVMLSLVERTGGGDHTVSARVMSDGSLRFLAILTALMQAPTLERTADGAASPARGSVPGDGEEADGQTTIVLEELENGLHASQATHLLGLIREQVARRRVRMVATAHSPALLDALTGDEHEDVVVCHRDGTGASRLVRLVDLPNYWRIAARGGLGRAAGADRLRAADDHEDAVAVVEEILGPRAR